MLYSNVLKNGTAILEAAGIDEASVDAMILFEYVFSMGKTDYLLRMNEEADDDLACKYIELITKRATRYPVQYITGSQNFFGYDYDVSENVLIPRQDTESLVDCICTYVKKSGIKPSVLDMCSGSGCIGLTLKMVGACESLTLADISDYAIELTSRNATKHGVLCDIVKSDLYDNIDGTYDIIVSNPPYIRSDVIEGLMDEVKLHEPRLALDGMEDGLFFYKKLIEEGVQHLTDGGYMFFEIGYDQAVDVENLFAENGFLDITVVKDMNGNDRVIYAHR